MKWNVETMSIKHYMLDQTDRTVYFDIVEEIKKINKAYANTINGAIRSYLKNYLYKDIPLKSLLLSKKDLNELIEYLKFINEYCRYTNFKFIYGGKVFRRLTIKLIDIFVKTYNNQTKRDLLLDQMFYLKGHFDINGSLITKPLVFK